MNYEEIREAMGAMRKHVDLHESVGLKRNELQGELSARVEVDGLVIYTTDGMVDDFLQQVEDHAEDKMEACLAVLCRAVNAPKVSR